ncbi:hypothetical protein LSH36_635g01011 [Paralvinella palmiformis]|uniref:Kinesin-like protein KIF6/9 C-terminal domain-containing protein n=1 Tax=Paralvinella palmiformis TaxID=53620 RepID=A0AAD9MUA1_9ANNE|nr:hypothetical protein LSH36_635g01011 [Paralvinella palmiformis]
MLKKEKKRAADAVSALEQQGHSLPKSSSSMSENGTSPSSGMSNGTTPMSNHQHMSDRAPSDRRWQSDQQKLQKEKEEITKAKICKIQFIIIISFYMKIVGEMSMGRQEAFEIFRRDYHHNQTIEENKALLKHKYAEAKSLGETVNQARTKINKLKTSIEQHRMSRVMQGLVNPDEPEADEMELEMKEQMENEKKRYKETFTKLRGLKTEIEHLQHLLEQSKVKLMKDFELWWAEQMTAVQEKQMLTKGGPTSQSKSAWRTPPITPNKHLLNSSQTSFTSTDVTEDQRPASRHHHNNQYYGEPRQPSLTSGYSSQESMTSSSSLRLRGSTSSSGSIPLTGDAQADADIMAFLKAREKLAKFAKKPR